MRRFAPVLLALLLFFSLASSASSAKKHPLVDFSVDSQGRAVALLQFGKEARPLLVRFTAAGAVDAGFSGDGILRPPLLGFTAHFTLGRDDSIVVGGQLANLPPGRSVVLRRYLSDGRRDRSFGAQGQVRLRYGELADLLTQPDGKIVALPIAVCPRRSCGYLYRSVQPTRLTLAGRELSHGQGSGEQWHLLTAAVEPDGGIFVVGEIVDESFVDFQRFEPSGRPEEELFEDVGLPPEAERGFEKEFVPAPSALAFLADGRYVETPLFGPELWLRNPDGSPDSSFGTEGRAACGYDPRPREYFGTYGAPFSDVAVSADQKLVAAGGAGGCGLVRFLADGSLDGSFGAGGLLDVEATGMRRPLKLALLPDGGVLLAGWEPAARALRVARYSAEGALVPGYGLGGLAGVSVAPRG